jgi:hypothetical protein
MKILSVQEYKAMRGWKDKAKHAVPFAYGQAVGYYYDELGIAPVGTWKERVFRAGEAALARIPPAETVARNVPQEVTGLTVAHAAGEGEATKEVLYATAACYDQFRRKFIVSTILLPFSTLLAVLPGPNFPFFILAYISFSALSAQRGAQKLSALLDQGNVNLVESDVVTRLGHANDEDDVVRLATQLNLPERDLIQQFRQLVYAQQKASKDASSKTTTAPSSTAPSNDSSAANSSSHQSGAANDASDVAGTGESARRKKHL